MPTVNKCHSGAKGCSNLPAAFYKSKQQFCIFTSEHSTCNLCSPVQRLLSGSTTKAQLSNEKGWIQLMDVCVEVWRDRESYFELILIHFSYLKPKDLVTSEKAIELPEYLSRNVTQTQPSVFRCLAQIQVTPQRKVVVFFSIRAIQQLLSCMDQCSFCWADVENEKKATQDNHPPDWQPHQRCHQLSGEEALTLCAFTKLFFSTGCCGFGLRFWCSISYRHNQQICFCSVSCKTGQSCPALSSGYTLTGWCIFWDKRKQLGLVPPSVFWVDPAYLTAGFCSPF